MTASVRLWERLVQTNPSLLTVCGLALATVLRIAMTPLLGQGFPFITYYPVIVLSTVVGGWRQGLAAMTASLLLSFFLFFGGGLSVDHEVALVADTVGNLLLIGCVDMIGRVRRRLELDACSARAREEALRRELEARRQADEELRASRAAALNLMEDAVEARQNAEQAHAALCESEERLALALQGSGDSLWDCDLAARRTMRNERWKALRGYASDEIGDGTWEWVDRLHPDDAERVLKAFADHCEGRTPVFREEYRVRCKDGSYRWIFDRGEVVRRDSSGRALRVMGFETDVTDRKRLEEERQKFVSLADSSVEFIGMCDLNFHPFYVNAAGMHLVGLDNLDMARRLKVQDYFFPEDQPFITDEFFPRVLSDGHGEVEIRFRHFKTGAAIWMLYNVFNIRDAAGAVVGWATVSRNIDGKKRAEEALRESEDDLKRAQAVGRIGSWRLDLRTDRLVWSEENHRIFGVPIGMSLNYETFLYAVHPKDRDYVDGKWRSALHGEPYDIEHRIVVDGQVKWVHEKAELEFDGDHNMVGAFGTTQDITEIKLAEEALREADRRKDEFLAMLAHELRNPLAPIRNAAQILRGIESADPKLVWTREVIDRQVTHLARLVDDLLDVARINRGKISLKKERIAVAALIERAVETCQPLIDERQHTLQVVLPPEPIWLDVDPVRIAQVIGNLLNNAAKYTEPGGHIWLTAALSDGELVLNVRDTGQGIAADLLPSVFDLFAQSARTLDRSQGGLGIGLTLVKQLVEMHGGTVAASSAGLQQGSQFTVRLPVSDVRFAAEGSEGAGNRCRILVADDSPDIADSLATLLRHQGHDVQMVHDGVAALIAVQRLAPEVVFVELGLPKLDGYEIARRLRSVPAGKDIRLIAMTGHYRDEDRQRAEAAGFDQHIVKPVDVATLKTLLAGPDKPSAPAAA